MIAPCSHHALAWCGVLDLWSLGLKSMPDLKAPFRSTDSCAVGSEASQALPYSQRI